MNKVEELFDEVRELHELMEKLPKSIEKKFLEFMYSLGFESFFQVDQEMRLSIKKVFERWIQREYNLKIMKPGETTKCE